MRTPSHVRNTTDPDTAVGTSVALIFTGSGRSREQRDANGPPHVTCFQLGCMPHCPQRNGLVERLIRTPKEQCVHRHRFESEQHAMRVTGDWIQFYN